MSKDNEQENVEGAEEAAEASGGGSNKGVIIAVVAAILVSNAGLAAFFFFMGPSLMGGAQAANPPEAAAEPAEEEVEAAPSATPGPLVPLDPFVVNLNEPGEPRYLRVSITLEATDKDAVTKIDEVKVRLRDAYLSKLSAYTTAELRSPEDKARLREALIEEAKKVVSPRAVQQLYFTDFMMQ
jgi:flagellar FliL protein